ncbi:hypothetical protein FA95DRAFT_1563039 [Auriscalpium vulgare]|uniref:Uncharacterized protein n=1 Tax=Auriscalpium vulgare TaxID=40419 RepID=A0ACB8RHL6_9AGAM|nr:hypothetical protein FA95DRAFT_1563039 [Auriscalpium vulgare]
MSATNATVPQGPPPVLTQDAATVIGPIFVGNVINWLLMGSLVVQVYMFHISYPSERIRIRLLVYIVFLLDVVQTVFGTHQAWFYMIANWSKPGTLDAEPWSAATIPIMCGLIAAIVQIFYAWRIWRMKDSVVMHVFSLMIAAIALAQGVTAVVASSIIQERPTQRNLLHLHPAFEFWLAGSFVADVLICGCMIWILYDAKTQTMWTESGSLFNRLILNAIQTGLVTVICATVDLALFVHFENANYHLTPAYILGKLYSNSLMVTLNARRRRTTRNTDLETAESLAMRVMVSQQTEQSRDKSARSTTVWTIPHDVTAPSTTVASVGDGHSKKVDLSETASESVISFRSEKLGATQSSPV